VHIAQGALDLAAAFENRFDFHEES